MKISLLKKSQRSQKNLHFASQNFFLQEKYFENFSIFKNDIICVEAKNVLLYKVPSCTIYQGLDPLIATSIQLKPMDSWGGQFCNQFCHLPLFVSEPWSKVTNYLLLIPMNSYRRPILLRALTCLFSFVALHSSCHVKLLSCRLR